MGVTISQIPHERDHAAVLWSQLATLCVTAGPQSRTGQSQWGARWFLLLGATNIPRSEIIWFPGFLENWLLYVGWPELIMRLQGDHLPRKCSPHARRKGGSMSIATIIGAIIGIAIVNGKGGSGKTPTAVQLAFALARMGYKVLFADLDQQGTASFHFLGFKYKRQQPTIYNALKDLARIEPLVIMANLHLLPAHDELQNLEIELPSRKGA